MIQDADNGIWLNRLCGIDEIGRLYSFLLKEGFDIVDHLVSKGADYSDIKDFRDKKELSHQIVNHDLEYVKKLMFWLYYQIGQVMAQPSRCLLPKVLERELHCSQRIPCKHRGQ